MSVIGHTTSRNAQACGDWRRIRTLARCGLCCLASLCLIGCGDPEHATYPVRGLVRFTDGKLLRNGTVEFEIMGRQKATTATGTINADGSFILGTHAFDDGALAGKHRVVVIADYEIGDGHERPWLIPKSQLHAKYRDYKTSGLVFEVKPELNNILIEVEYAPATE